MYQSIESGAPVPVDMYQAIAAQFWHWFIKMEEINKHKI